MNDRTLDCSDLDQYLGKPIAPARMKEPLHNNDFRRWVQAMHYPNLLHYDHDFAAAGRYGRLVAPQSFAVNFTVPEQVPAGRYDVMLAIPAPPDAKGNPGFTPVSCAGGIAKAASCLAGKIDIPAGR